MIKSCKSQKERITEAYNVHALFHLWMGYMVCDGEEDMLCLRKLVKKIEKDSIKQYKKDCWEGKKE
mgnify:CR=1 FL=1